MNKNQTLLLCIALQFVLSPIIEGALWFVGVPLLLCLSLQLIGFVITIILFQTMEGDEKPSQSWIATTAIAITVFGGMFAYAIIAIIFLSGFEG